MFCNHKTGQNYNIRTANKSFENMAEKFKQHNQLTD